MIKLISKGHYLYAVIISIIVYATSLSLYADTIKETSEGCLVTVDTLNKAEHANNTLFIDIRNKKTFNAKHISGSINIPLELIATKSFLKNKNVILVGSGWNESSLLDTCSQLKRKGYKSVRVLTGGIISWFIKQKNVPKRTLISLTSKEFFDVSFEKKFVPFVVSNIKKNQIDAVLPLAKTASLKATKKQLLSGFNRLGSGNNPIVIFSDAMSNMDGAIDAYMRKPLRKMYYFEGGFDVYQKVTNLNKMTALSNKSKRLSTKKPVSCAN